MRRIAVRAEGLGKKYRVGRRKTLAFRDAVGDAMRRLGSGMRSTTPDECEIWALRGASFEIREGEVVGVIGRNGAGKSTLLKILSRVTEPTEGRVELYGRVGSLLEVGTGFHPDLTGRENVFLSGAILGMSRTEIARKFGEIVAFAEVERFIDTQVKHFSSGMYMRLAFAVAAHLDPEILLVDEVLAVGDAAFQKKCLGRMGEIARGGRTVVFVSHNMAAIANLCGSAILMTSGRPEEAGPVEKVLRAYLAGAPPGGSGGTPAALVRPAWARPLITAVRVVTDRGDPTGSLPMGSSLLFEVDVNASNDGPLREPVLGIVLKHAIRGVVGGVNTRMTGGLEALKGLDRATLTCCLRKPPLLQGPYEVDVWLGDGAENIDCVESGASFEVVETDVYGTGNAPFGHMGVIWFAAEWNARSVQ